MYKNYKKQRVFIKTLNNITFKINNINFKLKRFILKYLEKFIPRSLLNRIIIYLGIVIFIILLGLIIFVYKQHWTKIREKLITGIANDIYYTSIFIQNNYDVQNISNVVYESFYTFTIIQNPSIKKLWEYFKYEKTSLSRNARILQNSLNKRFPNNTIYIIEDEKNNLKVLVPINNNNWGEFYISENVFFVSSLFSIAKYTFLLYVLLIIVSYSFFKFLLKPLKELSDSVAKFGKGYNVKYLNPEGAVEIKDTIKAFNEMKERINRYIEQRTLMLSAISHDLKSNLTKMSLLLELNENNSCINELKEEINNMNEMISQYLVFSRNEFNEEPKKNIKIKGFFNSIIKVTKLKPNQTLNITYRIFYDSINLRPLTFKRAIINVLDNAVKHSNNINISVKDTKRTHLKVTIDDDGSGINPSEYKNVFKPFVRLNSARTAEKGSVGLGLSIVKDAINKHGGDIKLGESPSKGLRVTIIIPY